MSDAACVAPIWRSTPVGQQPLLPVFIPLTLHLAVTTIGRAVGHDHAGDDRLETRVDPVRLKDG